MARQAGRDFIRSSSVGQPRLVKTPIDPQLGFPPIDEEVIYSRDRQLGFYWVAPQRMEDLPAYGHPHLAFNRDVLGETRARKMAEAEMEKQQARAAQVGEDLPELTVHGSDYLLGPYVRSSDGVYVYDQAK